MLNYKICRCALFVRLSDSKYFAISIALCTGSFVSLFFSLFLLFPGLSY